jgi:DNA-directed RNA polymerase beta' subunit
MKLISAAECHMISAQASKPNTTIVQDSLLGAFKMTNGVVRIRKDQFFNICMRLESDFDIVGQIEHIKQVLIELELTLEDGEADWINGRGLMSMLLPRDFHYEKKNDQNDPTVRIYKGVVYAGTFDKQILGASHNSIIQVLHKEYGSERAAQFVDEIQFFTNEWLLIKGFSIGLKDCMMPKEAKSVDDEIQDSMYKCFVKADGVEETTDHKGIREVRVSAALGGARDLGMKLAKDALAPDNNFLSTVKSGSKGDFFNITQSMGMLGQQQMKGQRIPNSMNNGERSTVHYPRRSGFADGELPTNMKYEARGFVGDSFIKGLTPRNWFAHAQAGREGITNTAMSTANSGYLQRKIIKLSEDLTVQYDGTVRDSTGKIVQNSYGGDGFDPTRTVKVDGGQECMDVSRLVDRLNIDHESKSN